MPVNVLSPCIDDVRIGTFWMAQGINSNPNELKGFLQLRSSRSSSAALQQVYCELTARHLEVFSFCPSVFVTAAGLTFLGLFVLMCLFLCAYEYFSFMPSFWVTAVRVVPRQSNRKGGHILTQGGMWGADEQVMDASPTALSFGISMSSVLHTIDLLTLSVTLRQPPKPDPCAWTLPPAPSSPLPRAAAVKPYGGLESTILEVSGRPGEVVLLQVLLQARMCVCVFKVCV
jgi:hypothetical protein